MRLFLTAFIVSWELTSVEPINEMSTQAVTTETNDPSDIQKNFRNLFDSIKKNDIKGSETYRDILGREAVRDQQAFHSMKDELQLARHGSAYQTTHSSHVVDEVAAVKREIHENATGTVGYTPVRYTQSSIKFPSFMMVSEKHTALFAELVDIFSDGDEAKKETLTKPIKTFEVIRSCYLDAMSFFMAYCPAHYDKFQGLKLFRDLFHRACYAKWLTTRNITDNVKLSCIRQKFVTVGSWP